jgi:hypothetical protein
LADVDNDIELLAAVFEGGDGFGSFDRSSMTAVRKSDGGGCFDVRPL